MPKRPASGHCTCDHTTCRDSEYRHHKRIRLQSNDRTTEARVITRQERHRSTSREMESTNMNMRRQKKRIRVTYNNNFPAHRSAGEDIYNPPRKRAKETRKKCFPTLIRTENDFETMKRICFEEDSYMIRWVKT